MWNILFMQARKEIIQKHYQQHRPGRIHVRLVAIPLHNNGQIYFRLDGSMGTFDPLYVFIIKRPNEKYLKIIAVYLLTSFCINLIIDVSWRFNKCMPQGLQNNNFLYNIISVCRVFFFVFFFMKTTSILSKKVYTLFLVLYI